jgi:solute carrier family 25 carnitine/acylcarnitine transporter 20/29
MSDASRGGDSTRPQQPPPPPRPLPPAWLDVAAGVFAGAANVVAGHPFDTVKVVLQAGNPGQHAGALDATRHILRQGGVRAMLHVFAASRAGRSSRD